MNEAIHSVYLGLGSNLGNKKRYIRQAIQQIKNQIGPVMGQSDFFLTEPEGFESKNQFINAVICIKTTLSPQQLLEVTQMIERQLGREQKSLNSVYHDRTIDIDILLYDELTIHLPHLTIPHPHMKERLFVLKPLAQIAPQLIIPGETKTIKEMLDCIC